MKKLLLLLILMLAWGFLYSQEQRLMDYSDLKAYLGPMFGIDPNTGITTLLTLVIPPGGKYEGMGTAYTAVSIDSGTLEANPSGTSRLDFTELSWFHKDWIADVAMESMIWTGRKDDLGYGVQLKHLHDGFTGWDMFGDRMEQPDGTLRKGLYSETVVSLNFSYNLFSTYYFNGVSVGTNLKCAYRFVSPEIEAGQSGLGLMADVGLLSRFNLLKFFMSKTKNFSVGILFKNLGPPILDDPLPTQAKLGICYLPLKPLTVAVDFIYPFDIRDPLRLQPQNYKPESIGLAVGLDAAVTPFFAFQTGFNFKLPNSSTSEIQDPRLSFGCITEIKENLSLSVSYILDLSTQLLSFDHFSIEAKMKFTDTKKAEKNKTVVDLYLKGLELYAVGKIEEAIEYWKKALELDSGYQPAQEMLDIAQKAMDLQNQMNKKQTLDK